MLRKIWFYTKCIVALTLLFAMAILMAAMMTAMGAIVLVLLAGALLPSGAFGAGVPLGSGLAACFLIGCAILVQLSCFFEFRPGSIRE